MIQRLGSLKKGSRPEVKIVSARPMNDVSTGDVRTNLQMNHQPNHLPRNDAQLATEILIPPPSKSVPPSKPARKQRPSSEIYNGFSSLKSSKTVKVDVEKLKKDGSKLGRSKSLYSPKKPQAKDGPVRPAPPPPSLNRSFSKDTTANNSSNASMTPTRPAPPLPFTSFNKNNPNDRSQVETTSQQVNSNKKKRSHSSSQLHDKRRKENPSKNASTIPRVTSIYDSVKVIKEYSKDNIVVLGRKNSLDETGKPEVKLKTFGIAASKSASDINKRALDSSSASEVDLSNKKAILTNEESTNATTDAKSTQQSSEIEGDHQNIPSATASLVQSNSQLKEPVSKDEPTTLHDAIQASAVLNRLKQLNESMGPEEQLGCNEDLNKSTPAKQMPKAGCLNSSNETDVSNVLTFSDALNSSKLLARLKQVPNNEESTLATNDASIKSCHKGLSTNSLLNDKSGSSEAVTNVSSDKLKPYDQQHDQSASQQGKSVMSVRPVASYIVSSKVKDSRSEHMTKVKRHSKDIMQTEAMDNSSPKCDTEGSSCRAKPQGRRSLPPETKPKPKITKNTSMGAIRQWRSEDNSDSLSHTQEEMITRKSSLSNQLFPKSLPLIIKANNSKDKGIVNEQKKSYGELENGDPNAVNMNMEEQATNVCNPSTDMIKGSPLIIKTSKAKQGVANGKCRENHKETSSIGPGSAVEMPEKCVTSPAHDDAFSGLPTSSDTKFDANEQNFDEPQERRNSADRKKSESEAESTGSVDSLSSVTSQVTVIFNPNTVPAQPEKRPSGPYESHETNIRKRSVPEPYSSHKERRPKPFKPPPITSTIKSKKRNSRSFGGRRPQSSPPSTPPPPPKVTEAMTEPAITKTERPPVPPRAPNMCVENDMRSLDASSKISDSPSIEGCGPKRPEKPTFLKSLVTEDKTVSAVNNNSLKHPSVTENHSIINVEERKFVFSQKIEMFNKSSEKPNRPPILRKQRSLDSEQNESANEPKSSTSEEQIRKDGKEVLAMVSKLRMKEHTVNKEGEGKNFPPKKPKRPLSFSMENFMIGSLIENHEAISSDLSMRSKRTPPAKPARPGAFFKASSVEESIGGSRAGDEPGVETSREYKVHKIDPGKHNEKVKNTPQKPVRTSSLRKKKPVTVQKKPKEMKNGPAEANGDKESDGDLIFENKIDLQSQIIKLDEIITQTSSVLQDQSPPSLKETAANVCRREMTTGDSAPQIDVNEQGTETPDSCENANEHYKSKVPLLSEYVDQNHDTKMPPRRPVQLPNVSLCNQQTNVDRCETVAYENFDLNDNKTDFSVPTSEIKSIAGSSNDTPVSSELVESKIDKVICDDLCDETAMVGENKQITCTLANANVSNITNVADLISADTVGVANVVDAVDVVNADIANVANVANKTVINDSALTSNSEIDEALHNKEIPTLINTADCKAQENELITVDSDKIVFTEIVSPDSDTKSIKKAPAKPSRPASFPKVRNTEFVMSLQQQTFVERRVPPPRPNSLPPQIVNKNDMITSELEKACDRPISLQIAPVAVEEKPDQNVTLKQSPTRATRPPVPMILRDNTDESEIKKDAENCGMMAQLRKNMEVTDPHCIAIFDYVSENQNDLAFKAGDLIYLERQMNEEWFYGSKDEMKGMFPCKFVEVIIELDDGKKTSEVGEVYVFVKEQLNKETVTKDIFVQLEKPHALALHSFVASNDDELSFESSDTIDLISRVDESWLKGSCRGQTGIFPVSFVVVVKPLTEQSSTNTVDNTIDAVNENDNRCSKDASSDENLSGRICTALADYSSTVEGDLCFKAGQDIRLISKVNCDWLKGVLHTKTGIFPSSFVKILNVSDSSPEADKKDAMKKPDATKISEHSATEKENAFEGKDPCTFSPKANDDDQKSKAPKAKAIYDFNALEVGELNFQVNDVIYLKRHIDDGWFEGELNGETGKFPGSFVEVLVPL